MGITTDKFINTVSDLYADWIKVGSGRGIRNKDDQRFGQYALNSLYTTEFRSSLPETWPELFYEENPRVAFGMLYQYAHSLTD